MPGGSINHRLCSASRCQRLQRCNTEKIWSIRRMTTREKLILKRNWMCTICNRSQKNIECLNICVGKESNMTKIRFEA